MALLHFHSSLSLARITSSFNPNPNPKKPNNPTPARDLRIDFGKHKGRMLGSLPSAYLRWISSSLRSGDSLRWAELADDVLDDPVYRDRIEWEHAERILSGNNANTLRASTNSSVSGLLEISERFGWDNEDRDGWARVDFGLLGTSKVGRIPRIRVGDGGGRRALSSDKANALRASSNSGVSGLLGRDRLRGSGSNGFVKGESGRREERRQRRRAKRETMGGQEEEEEEEEEELGFGRRNLRGFGGNPFPGRGALLDKIKRGGE